MGKKVDTYYYTGVFNTFEDALAAQHRVLMEFIQKGEAIRDCSLDWETDFDTKKQKFKVMVRHYLIVREDDETPRTG